MSKRKPPKVLAITDLEQKGTKELLGYLKRLHRCEESFELSDMDEDPELADSQTIYFKQSEKWKVAHKNIKFILSKRKHIEK